MRIEIVHREPRQRGVEHFKFLDHSAEGHKLRVRSRAGSLAKSGCLTTAYPRSDKYPIDSLYSTRIDLNAKKAHGPATRSTPTAAAPDKGQGQPPTNEL